MTTADVRLPQVFNYHFRMHKDSASAEELGAIVLENDSEATAFAVRVIRDIKNGAPGNHDGWTMNITERGRDAGSVLFDSVEIAH
jgi:hypothetical protein